MKKTIFLMLITSIMLSLTNCNKNNESIPSDSDCTSEKLSSDTPEKLSYTVKIPEENKRKTIEFNVSPDEFYVEFSTDQLARIKKVTTWRFQKFDRKGGFITLKNPKGNRFSLRSVQLQSPCPFPFSKIEPVLIYKDGTTKQISTGEIIIELSNKQDLKDLLRRYNYTVEEDEFTKNQFFVTFRNKNTQQIFTLISELNKSNKVVFAEPNFTRFLKRLSSSKNANANNPFLKPQWAMNHQK